MATNSLPRPNEPPDLLNRVLARAYSVNWEMVAYFAIFVLAILTRFIDLGARVMSHDESLHTYYSWRLQTAGDFNHTPLMHGPILFHVTALMYALFGDNDFVARIYPAVLGVIMVMMPLLFRRWLGRWGALLASVGLLISPLLLYYNRYIREDTPCFVAAMFMAYALFMYIDGPPNLRRRARWLFLLAGATLWSLGSKESGFIYIAIFGSFLTLYWLARVYQAWRRSPMRRTFSLITVGTLVGALAALGMYMVFSIALYGHATLDARLAYLGTQIQALVSGQPIGTDFGAFIGWTLIVVAIIVALVFGTALWATRHGGRVRRGDILLLLLIALVVSVALIGFEEITQEPKPAEAEGADTITVADISYAPIVGAWVGSAVVIAFLLYAKRKGWWRLLYRFPEFDALIVLGTLVLPWLSAIILRATGADPTDYSYPLGIERAVLSVVPLIALSVVAGLLWNWKRWIICALVFYVPFAFFFTTMFTNPLGLATGVIGSLGYWLKQQAVQRGSQPRYYYALVVMPVYEYLPIIGSVLAMLAGMVGFWRYQAARPAEVAAGKPPELVDGEAVETIPESVEILAAPETPLLQREGALVRPSFLLFVSWWGIFDFIGYTLAGEKMPWLGTHLTIPFILLTAWYFGRVFERVDWSVFRWRGWLYLILLPLFGITLFQVVSPLLVGVSPFQGLQQQQLSEFYRWLAVVGVAVLVGYLIVQVALRTGFMHLRRMVGVAAFLVLSLMTFRTAFTAAFVNYDYANEFLVYAHGAPGIKRMMEQIEDISRRTTDSLNVKFAWGGNAWPVTWYFRNLTNATFFGENPTVQSLNDAVVVYVSSDIRSRVEPLLEDRYYKFEYIRMWWPDQEYFYLNADRVLNTLDFSPENTQAAQIRLGMWDIWWNRDYTRYGEAINKDYSLQNWPVAEDLFFYVRKDVAAQVWNLGTGEGTVMNPIADLPVNVCTSNWQQKFAALVFAQGQALAMNHPLDVAVDDEFGLVYVAEEFNNRVSVFDKGGTFLEALQGGTEDFAGFNRPNGVAVAPDGDLYVADTWNFSIREFSPESDLLQSWGQPGQFGAGAQVEPVDGFWGPRDVAVDADGNVYVADTGNKRVRVYNADGEYLRDIGYAGSALGQLDEPSGLAIDDENDLLYVADTWNQRVSVFNLEGVPQFTFDVRGWYEDLGNRPYLAFDQTRHLVYVTDPDAGRVLVYDGQGNCVGSFGQPSDTPTDNSQFNTVSGIAVDADGNVYIADSGAARVLKFPPFVDDVMPQGEQTEQLESFPDDFVTEEITAEVPAG